MKEVKRKARRYLAMKSNNTDKHIVIYLEDCEDKEIRMPTYEELQKTLLGILNSDCRTSKCSPEVASFVMELRA